MGTCNIKLKPRYKQASYLANDILLKYNFNTLPIDIDTVLNKYADLYTFTAAQRNGYINRLALARVINSKDGAAIYVPSQNRYIIMIDDNITSKGRLRWTKGHELGHVVFNHFLDLPILAINKNPPAELMMVLEQEVNAFTRQFFAPDVVVTMLRSVFNALDFKGIYTVSRCFLNLSKEASRNIAANTLKTPIMSISLNSPLYGLFEKEVCRLFTDYRGDPFDSLLRKYSRELDNYNWDYNKRILSFSEGYSNI